MSDTYSRSLDGATMVRVQDHIYVSEGAGRALGLASLAPASEQYAALPRQGGRQRSRRRAPSSNAGVVPSAVRTGGAA